MRENHLEDLFNRNLGDPTSKVYDPVDLGSDLRI